MRHLALRRTGWASAGILLALGLLFHAFRGVELTALSQALSRVSPALLPLVLVPTLLTLSLESTGWRGALVRMGYRVTVPQLLLVRAKTEALTLTLPLGTVACDSVTPALLREQGVPLPAGVAAVGVRRYLLVLSQACFVALAFGLGHAHLADALEALGAPRWLGASTLVAALVLLLTALLLRAVLHRGAVAGRALKLLLTVPSKALQTWLLRTRSQFDFADEHLARLFSRRLTLKQLAPFVLLWAVESAESLLILRLLGVEIGFVELISFEVLLTLARNLAFMVPAGIGVQDLGYVTFLGALGIADPVHIGAAFSLIKRSKELTWAALGYALLAFTRPAFGSTTPAPQI